MPPTIKRAIGTVLAALALAPAPRAAAQPPVHEIQVVASAFQFEPAALHVVAGERVRLVVRSKDVSHGLAIPALKVDERVPKGGEPVTVTFTAPAPGEYEIACSEFCGRGHGHMKAVLVSVAAPTQTNR